MSPLPPGLGTKLRHLIASLDGDVQALYDDLAVPFRPRFYPVVRLLLDGPQTVSTIAGQVGVSQPAITQTLREMKKLRLIGANAGTDRRTQLVRLTAQGESLAATLAPVWEATHRAAARLESELPARLGEIVDQALAALARQSFRQRINAALAGQQ